MSSRALPLPLLLPLLALCLSAVVGCSSASGNMRLSSGGDADSSLEPMEGGASTDIGTKRFKTSVCQGIDLKPEYSLLDENALLKFLKEQGLETRLTPARGDLVYLDVMNGGTREPVRLRVAILKSSYEAGRDLHDALLQHGHGSWGVHRSNLAVLGPIASSEDAIVFAVKTKLACWGVMTMAGRDDTFVIPGGYLEL